MSVNLPSLRITSIRVKALLGWVDWTVLLYGLEKGFQEFIFYTVIINLAGAPDEVPAPAMASDICKNIASLLSQNHHHIDSVSHFEVELHSLVELLNASTSDASWPLELVGAKVHQEHGNPVN